MSEEAKKHVHVIKRNGEEVTFDLSKIENAILAANNEVDNLHQLNEYQVHAIADNLEKQIESMSHAVHVGYTGYGRDRNHGDARIRGCTEICALPL